MDSSVYPFLFVAMFILSVAGIGAIFHCESPPENPDKKYPHRSGPEIDSMRIVYAAWAEYKRVKNNELRKKNL
jgi:hypothetical protein